MKNSVFYACTLLPDNAVLLINAGRIADNALFFAGKPRLQPNCIALYFGIQYSITMDMQILHVSEHHEICAMPLGSRCSFCLSILRTESGVLA